MSDAAPSDEFAGTSEGRGPLTPGQIDAVLTDFRAWLTELAEPPDDVPDQDDDAIDLATVVAAFTALRHDVTLQTKATRALGERVTQLLEREPAHDEPEPPPPSENDEAVRSLLKTLVDVYDALSLASREVEKPKPAVGGWFASWRTPPPDPVVEALAAGYRLSLQRIDRAMAQHGLQAIPTHGAAFDPELMEAVEAVASDTATGTVLAEVRRGYLRGGRVFRYSQVRVAR